MRAGHEMGWYCPVCWAEWGEGTDACLMCGGRRDEEEGFVARLISGLRADEISVAQHAARILGERRERDAVPGLLAAVASATDEFLLEAVATALGRIGDRRAVEPLCLVVQRGPRAAREAACDALARLGAVEALPVLRGMSSSLGASGLRAIAYLEGRAATLPPDAWARWQRRPPLGGDPIVLVREKAGLSGCPVCALMSEDLAGFLGQWLYLSGVQAAVASRFSERNGFCVDHLGALREIASPEGLHGCLIALFARLTDALCGAQAGASRRGLTGAADALLGQESTCQACALCAQAEMRYIRALADLAADEAYRRSQRKGCGLCLPHFLSLRQRLQDCALREWLEEAERSYLDHLLALMQSHARKHGQRLRSEITPVERRSAWQALRTLSGDPAVRPGISGRVAAPPGEA